MSYPRPWWFTGCILIALASTVFARGTTRPEGSPRPPTIPVGLDAYRMWDRWPVQRLGARAYMRSTYDRSGGNETADASHYLYQLADDFNVTLDVEGPGILYFTRYNRWHGSPWHYEVDGEDHVVRETSTATPNEPVEGSVFMPEELFPNPLTWTWSRTKGADLMWVPIPFEDRFRMAYGRTRYGTGYYIYKKYMPGAPLSQPIESWDAETPPDPAVLDLLRSAGTDIAPKPDKEQATVREASGRLDLAAGQTATLSNLKKAPAMLRALKISAPRDQALALGRTRIRITWDGREHPSVDAPTSLFFGAGTLYNRDGREYIVKALPMNIRFAEDRVHLACYFPMPFFRSARIKLVNPTDEDLTGLRWSARTQPYDGPPEHVAYFHATYRDHPKPEPGKDLTWLDTNQAEGGGPWSGHFVGTSFIFTDRANLRTLEGDPRFFFDGSKTPQAYGTGTEEWGGGGDYWGGLTMTLPLVGHPVGGEPGKTKNKLDEIHSAYRFLLADLMPFGRRAVIRFEHGGLNQSTDHYQTVVYWYGAPSPALVKTDTLNVGDTEQEKQHRYTSPEASDPYQRRSRYEWGVDQIRTDEEADLHREIYPAHTETGRATTGASEFTLEIRPDNLGVMLRRTLDYGFAHQRANVYVADDADADEPQWREAGVWYLAGSNTNVYSWPREERGPTSHIVQTSNRRFRDDEFLLPRELTEGRERIRVRVEFTPVDIPLFPGYPLQARAWSEIRYQAYSYIMPRSPINP